ncbi:MAG: hypothetical protein ACXVL8_03090 [Acidimicrobiia bacterium]
MAAGVLLLGYVVALVPARLCHLDIGSFRRTLWTGIGNRGRWLNTLRASYIAFGWPSLAVVLAWRTSKTRSALVELREQMRASERPRN